MTDNTHTTPRKINTHDPLYTDALALRREVFVEEQKVPEDLEYDELDAIATHFVTQHNGQVIATLRLVDGKPGEVKVGRVAVKATHRRQGIASALIRAALVYAGQHGYTTASLHAQTGALALYEHLGFVTYGDLFWEAGIEHLAMKRALPIAAEEM